MLNVRILSVTSNPLACWVVWGETREEAEQLFRQFLAGGYPRPIYRVVARRKLDHIRGYAQ